MLSVNIKKRLGSFVMDVNFETDREILALLGASGCGKSMTLKCIAGIETPDEGRIVLNGRILFDSKKGIDLTPQKRRVGYLFQQYALFPNMTVKQNIAAALSHLPRREREAPIREKISAFHLEGLEMHRPHQLSGGQQQRVALARMMAGNPEVLLLDEPFSALDSYLKWQLELEMMDTLEAYAGDVLFVSHNRDEVYRLCDTVCVLTAGRSEEKESVKNLMHSPKTVSAALLSGCKNFSVAEKIDEFHVRCPDWGITLRADRVPEGVSFVGIRAHHFKPSEDAPGKETATETATENETETATENENESETENKNENESENRIPCQVLRVVEEAFSTVVMLSTPAGKEGRGLLRIEVDKEVWAKFHHVKNLTVSVSPSQVLPLFGEGV